MATSTALQQPRSAPTPREIDALVETFEKVRDKAELADEAYQNASLELIDLVNTFGFVPAGAESSVRLQGAITVLTVTTGSSVTVKDSEVGKLKGAMDANKLGDLFSRMFTAHSKYKLVKGAATQLHVAQLPQRLADKLTQLYARCFDVKTKSPSLKIDRLADAKKPRAKKGGR
ncbi:MAG: hypothetical protein BGO25_05715 [Acidobacteriales bacterium 59-55]|nr:hypothetical protein [Terriglobales bacterium]ODU54620.1 MAG: hypothetical protein ABT04_02495 [Granulicella sp. SCN 62-9]OJV44580.1 MAG: hypothetical protein BGO25_05715 [Acidobacteriales bacterium 59-55]